MDVLMVAAVGAAALAGAVGVSLGIARLRKRDWKSAFRGPTFGATLGVSVAAAASAMHARPPHAVDKYRSQIESDPAYIALRKSDPNAKDTLASLTQEGMRRLSPSEVRAAAALMLKVADSDAGACSAMWPPSSDRTAVAKGVKALAPGDRDALMQLTTAATLHGLHHDGELRARASTPDAQLALYLAACNALPPAEGLRLRTLLLEGATAKTDACDGTRLLFRAIQSLPDDPGGQLFVSML